MESLRNGRKASFWQGAGLFGVVSVVGGIFVGAVAAVNLLLLTVPMAYDQATKVAAYQQVAAERDSRDIGVDGEVK